MNSLSECDLTTCRNEPWVVPVKIIPIAAIFLMSLLAAHTCNSAHADSAASASSDSFTIALAGQVPGEARRPLFNLTLDVSRKNGSKDSRISWLSEYSIEDSSLQITHLHGSLFAIVQRTKRSPLSLAPMAILDASRAAIVDELSGYQPEISPNGRYIAYRKFFRPHETHEAQSAVVLVYDTTVTPARQRLQPTEEPWNMVGYPVYPDVYAKAGAYVVPEQLNSSFYHTLNSPFLWSPDSSAIVFLSSHHNSTFIVKVSIQGNPEKPAIAESLVKIGMYISDELPPEERTRHMNTTKSFCARNLRWVDGKRVSVVNEPACYRFARKEFILTLPE